MKNSNSYKKKILHCVYSFEMGGAEKVVCYYAQYHDKNKYEPIICSLTKGGELESEIKKCNVRTYIFNKQKVPSVFFIWKLIKFIKDEKVDIIHSHNLVVNNWFVLASLFSGVRHVLRTDHTIQNKFYKKGFLFFIISTILGTLNTKVISVSEKIRILNKKKAILDRGRHTTIYNGIDPYLYTTKNIDKKKYYKEFQINEKFKIVGNIGNLTSQKGQKYLLEALKKILEQYKDIAFLIIGDGPLKMELESLAVKLNIRKNVFFVGFRNDIPELLQFMDVFVLSSLREGFSIALLEAMASAKACVATDVGGNSEAIENGRTGYIVPPEDPFQLADKILLLLKNKELSNKFGEKGRRRILNNFTADLMVKKTEKLYDL